MAQVIMPPLLAYCRGTDLRLRVMYLTTHGKYITYHEFNKLKEYHSRNCTNVRGEKGDPKQQVVQLIGIQEHHKTREGDRRDKRTGALN